MGPFGGYEAMGILSMVYPISARFNVERTPQVGCQIRILEVLQILQTS